MLETSEYYLRLHRCKFWLVMPFLAVHVYQYFRQKIWYSYVEDEGFQSDINSDFRAPSPQGVAYLFGEIRSISQHKIKT